MPKGSQTVDVGMRNCPEEMSGYSVKGHHAHPIYEENTSYTQIKHGRKAIYTWHQRFMKACNPYWQLKNLLMEVKSMKMRRYH